MRADHDIGLGVSLDQRERPAEARRQHVPHRLPPRAHSLSPRAATLERAAASLFREPSALGIDQHSFLGTQSARQRPHPCDLALRVTRPRPTNAFGSRPPAMSRHGSARSCLLQHVAQADAVPLVTSAEGSKVSTMLAWRMSTSMGPGSTTSSPSTSMRSENSHEAPNSTVAQAPWTA